MSNENNVVVAQYNIQEIFKIPKGINLNDNTQVKSWNIKWNKLYILLVGKDDYIIVENEGYVQNMDLKYADKVTIENGEEWGIEPDE